MSRRIQRINQLLKEEISKILLKEIDFPKDILVTVTRVETSPDLRQAKIFISIIPDNQNSRIFPILKRNLSLFQKKIGQRLSIKVIPKINFLEEKETKTAARIEEILEELKKEGK